MSILFQYGRQRPGKASACRWRNYWPGAAGGNWLSRQKPTEAGAVLCTPATLSTMLRSATSSQMTYPHCGNPAVFSVHELPPAGVGDEPLAGTMAPGNGAVNMLKDP